MSTQRGRDRRSEWKFLITDQGWLWVVTRPGGIEERATTAYQTMQEAGEDAMKHGYGKWKTDERRQGDRREFED